MYVLTHKLTNSLVYIYIYMCYTHTSNRRSQLRSLPVTSLARAIARAADTYQ